MAAWRIGTAVDPADLQTYMGTEKSHAIHELTALGGIYLPDELLAERFQRFTTLLSELYAQRPPVGLPGVAEAIDLLRESGVKVALTTGFAADTGQPLVDSLDWWDRLDAVVYASEIPRGRPAPYMIFRAMEATGVLPVSGVLVAGDTVVDLEAAANAGAGWRIGVLTGALDADALRGHGETHILAGVRDIPELLGCSGWLKDLARS